MKRYRRSLTSSLTLALVATQLGGCVAAALVPLAAGGTLTGKQLIGRKAASEKAAGAQTPVKPVVIVGQGSTAASGPTPAEAAPTVSEPAIAAPLPASSSSASSSAAPSVPATPELATTGAVTAAIIESPSLADDAGPQSATASPDMETPVSASTDPVPDSAAGYSQMAAFVLAAADAAKASGKRKSALLDQASLVSVPRTMMCEDQRGALLIDLDTGTEAFDLDDPPSPAPGLAEYLRAIRGTGTAVVWIASLPESASNRLSTTLKATGLDPLGIDPVLLLRRNETRKQQILLRADQDWCVLAIAGDRKADFDEVFDYLRNPDGPVAVALEQNIGAGWFLVPPPIK